MNILIIGSGAREHSLAWKLAQSRDQHCKSRVDKIYIAPGNGGSAPRTENVDIQATDIAGLTRFAEEKGIILTIVGPENPLALDIVTTFRRFDLKIFGPTAEAAGIELSKGKAKDLAIKAGVPTGRFQRFKDYEPALAYIREVGTPIVIKADGSALGKGVKVCHRTEQAELFLKEVMVDRIFGNAGSEVVIEEFLDGIEVSVHALCDGSGNDDFILFPPSQDHKRIADGNLGENTGGMGAVVPMPSVSKAAMREIGRSIVRPTLQALRQEGHPFSGLLFPGLMRTKNGMQVLEFNARFGDPETQTYMRLLQGDLLTPLMAAAKGSLRDRKGQKIQMVWRKGYAICVVLASQGYPGKYQIGYPIEGIKDAEKVPGVVIFHAGTKKVGGRLQTAGGRVLSVTAIGDTLEQAIDRAYEAVRLIRFVGKTYRRDIGQQARALL